MQLCTHPSRSRAYAPCTTIHVGGANWIEVEPSPQYIGHAQFSIVGYRMSGKHEDLVGPTITCSSDSDVPPPSPPKRQPDCELMPEVEAYPLGATREAGSDITVRGSEYELYLSD